MKKIVHNLVNNRSSIELSKKTISKIIMVREQRAEGMDVNDLSKIYKEPVLTINKWCKQSFEIYGGPTTVMG